MENAQESVVISRLAQDGFPRIASIQGVQPVGFIRSCWSWHPTLVPQRAITVNES